VFNTGLLIEIEAGSDISEIPLFRAKPRKIRTIIEIN